MKKELCVKLVVYKNCDFEFTSMKHEESTLYSLQFSVYSIR
jgi:hypothetical protein